MFPGPLGQSLAGRALAEGLWSMAVVDIRDYARDKHRTVDDTPFGGGPGMVMRPDVLAAAIDDTIAAGQDRGAAEQPLLYFSPRGRRLDQALVHEVKAAGGATLLCGRFEGVDERLLQARPVVEVSLGDFVLSGGEIPALALVDAVARRLPGALTEGSGEVESFSAALDGGLEYPHYTRPAEFRGWSVPDILLSGDHARIEDWRRQHVRSLT